jgi:hypothetical protein
MTNAHAPLFGPRPRWLALIGVLAGGALLLAACGAGPSNPGNAAVAHLGSTTTKAPNSNGGATLSNGGAPGGGSGPSTGNGGLSSQSGFTMVGGSQSQMLAFSHCMQTHGVPNYPDPNGQGVIQGDTNMGSPSAEAAQNDCQHLIPHSQPTPAQQAQAEAQALKFTQCMRQHGIVDFPDPQFGNGGGARISIKVGGKGSDMNPQNPQFQAAMKVCQGNLPAKGRFASTGGPK